MIGTDVNPDVVAEASQRLGIEIRCGEIQSVNFEKNSFDFIHVRDVLEHVTNPMEFLNECRRILKNDGTLYISVPNGSADLQAKLNSYSKNQIPSTTNTGHIFFFPSVALNLMFEKSGFKICKTYSFGFKKGLRSFNLWPSRLKTDFKNNKSTSIDKVPVKPAGAIAEKIHYPNKKYILRFFLDELFQLPGIYKYGFDYIYVLKPI